MTNGLHVSIILEPPLMELDTPWRRTCAKVLYINKTKEESRSLTDLTNKLQAICNIVINT